MVVRVSCVMCADHKHGFHDPKLRRCPNCGVWYCKKDFASLPVGKVGLISKGKQCIKCNAVFK